MAQRINGITFTHSTPSTKGLIRGSYAYRLILEAGMWKVDRSDYGTPWTSLGDPQGYPSLKRATEALRPYLK